MAFNHPSSSNNNNGAITNHHFATLPGLQPVDDGDSHKQEIPASLIPLVTTNNASPSNCACPRPHQPFFHFSEKNEVPPLKCIGLTRRFVITSPNPTNLCPTSANSTWCHLWSALFLRDCLNYFPKPYQSLLFQFSEKHEVLSLNCIGFSRPLINIYICIYIPGILLTTFPERRIPLENPPTPEVIN